MTGTNREETMSLEMPPLSEAEKSFLETKKKMEHQKKLADWALKVRDVLGQIQRRDPRMCDSDIDELILSFPSGNKP